jgi:hypothetical protein
VIHFGAEDRNVLSLRSFWLGEQWVRLKPNFTEGPKRILPVRCKFVVQVGQNSIEEVSTNICHAVLSFVNVAAVYTVLCLLLDLAEIPCNIKGKGKAVPLQA